MPNHSNVTVIQTFIDAHNHHDWDTLSSLLDEKFIWFITSGSPKYTGITKNKQEMVDFLKDIAKITNGTLQSHAHKIFADDERGVALVTETGERKAERLTLNENAVYEFRFQNGKMTEFKGVAERPEGYTKFWA
jgi:SnoaL-like domain